MNVGILITMCCLLAGEVHGYNQDCDQNLTIFATEESIATFRFNIARHHIPLIDFDKTDEPKIKKYILDARVRNENISEDYIHWYDDSWEQRSHIECKQNGNGHLSVAIVLSKVTMNDNGTYMADLFDKNACFILFVMQIKTESSGPIEEDKPLYVYGHPRKSVIKRAFANATMVWLLNGLYVNATANWIQGDGYIWIPRAYRDLEGKNVTYRAIQENGAVNDVNYTLNINHGPTQPLTLNPGKTQYYLVSGDTIPDITCSTECKPVCSMSWENYSNSPTLSLGTVQSTNTGEYTCTALRKGVKAAQMTISIYVTDNSLFTIAIACLAGFQAMMTIGLGLNAYYSYRLYRQEQCKTSKTQQTSDRKPATELNPPIANIQLDDYEELDACTGTRLSNMTYGNTNINQPIKGTPKDDGLEIYENTKNIG